MTVTNNHSLSMLLAGMLADPSILANMTVTGISQDSRDVQTGNLFLSLAKEEGQRESNLQQALRANISVVLFDSKQTLTEKENALINQSEIIAYPVRNLSNKASEIASRFYGHPSMALTIIAVTGTNGKTSVSQFIAQALESLGSACGVIGTLGVGRVDDFQLTGMTTPDPISIQKTLAGFCQQGIKYAVIEASSHALVQGRLNSITIDVAVLTNLSRDHLDYHGDMAEYSAAKKNLFDFDSVRTAVINGADSFGQSLIKTLADRKNVAILTYESTEKFNSVFQAKNINMTSNGIQFDLWNKLESAKFESELLGQFNIDNLLAALASLIAIDISFDHAVSAIKQCHAVDGRMQSYSSDKYAQIVVDFAHTPDALTQALISLREHVNKGDVWCVFGCGGDRDTGKRKLMGKAVEQCADHIIITDDNPRGEDAALIVNDILSGLNNPDSVVIEHDRKLAITHAIIHAETDDVVLIAGKGHEQYQEIKGVKYPFSDANVISDILYKENDDNSMLIGNRA